METERAAAAARKEERQRRALEQEALHAAQRASRPVRVPEDRPDLVEVERERARRAEESREAIRLRDLRIAEEKKILEQEKAAEIAAKLAAEDLTRRERAILARETQLKAEQAQRALQLAHEQKIADAAKLKALEAQAKAAAIQKQLAAEKVAKPTKFVFVKAQSIATKKKSKYADVQVTGELDAYLTSPEPVQFVVSEIQRDVQAELKLAEKPHEYVVDELDALIADAPSRVVETVEQEYAEPNKMMAPSLAFYEVPEIKTGMESTFNRFSPLPVEQINAPAEEQQQFEEQPKRTTPFVLNPEGKNRRERRAPKPFVSYDPLDEAYDDLEQKINFVQDAAFQAEKLVKANVIMGGKGTRLRTKKTTRTVDTSAVEPAATMIARTGDKYGFTGFLLRDKQDGSIGSGVEFSKFSHLGFPTRQVLQHVNVTLTVEKAGEPDISWYQNMFKDEELGLEFAQWIYDETTFPYRFKWTEEAFKRGAHLNTVLHPEPRQVSLSPGEFRWECKVVPLDAKKTQTIYKPYKADNDQIEVEGILLSKRKVPLRSMRFDDLTRRIRKKLLDLDPQNVLPNENLVAISPSVFYNVVNVIKKLRLATDIPSLLRYIGIAVKRTVDNAKAYYVKHGMSLTDYRREYNRVFGKIANTKQMKTLLDDSAAAGGSGADIRSNIIANLASHEMEKVARTLGTNRRGRKNQQKLRDEKMAPQSGRVYAGVSGLLNGGVNLVKTLFSTIWNAISSVVKGIKDHLIIIYQMRIVSLCKLFIALMNPTPYGIISEIVSCVLAWYPISDFPEYINKLISLVMDVKKEEVEPTVRSGYRKMESIAGVAYIPEDQYIQLTTLMNNVVWKENMDEADNTMLRREDIDYSALSNIFHQILGLKEGSQVHGPNYTMAKILWDAVATIEVEAPQMGFAFVKTIMSSVPFLSTIIGLLGCESISEFNHKASDLKKLSDTVFALLRGATTISTAFKYVMSAICGNLFGFDPFDGFKTLALATVTDAISFLSTFKQSDSPEMMAQNNKKFDACGSLLTLQLSTLVPQHLVTMLSNLYIKNMPAYFANTTNLENPRPRIPPLGILFGGTAGKGKSAACLNLVPLLLPLINRDDNGNPIVYHKSQTMQVPSGSNWWWDGISQYTPHINDDELFTVIDPAGQTVTLMSNFITKFVSAQRYMYDMAFEGKGKFTSVAKLYTVCTNTSNPEPGMFPVPDATAIGRRFKVFIEVEDQNSDEAGRAFVKQHFNVSGDYLNEWCVANNRDMFEAESFIWHQIRFPHTNPNCYVTLNGEELIDFCVFTYKMHVQSCDKAILQQSDINLFSAMFEEKYKGKLATSNSIQVLRDDSITITPIKLKDLSTTHNEVKRVKTTKNVQDPKDPPKEGPQGKKDENHIIQNAAQVFGTIAPTTESILEKLTRHFKDNVWPICIVTALFLCGGLLYRYMSESAPDHPQSPNIQHIGKVSERSKNPHVTTARYKGVTHTGAPKVKGPMRPMMEREDPQAGVDSVDNRVMREISMSKAFVKVQVTVINDDNEMSRINSRGVFINPHNLVIPAHYDIHGVIVSITVTDFRQTYTDVIPLGVVMDPTHDLSCIIFDGRSSGGLCPHASAEKMFWPRQTPSNQARPDSYFVDKSLRYYVYTPETRNLHVTDVYVADVATSCYEITDPYARTWEINGTLRFKRGFADGTCGTMYGIEERGTMYLCGFHICGSSTTGGAAIMDDCYVKWMNDVANTSYPNHKGVEYSEPPNFFEEDGSGVPVFKPVPESDKPLTGEVFKIPQEWFDLMGHYPKNGVATVQAPLLRGTKYVPTPFCGDLPAEPDCVPLNMYPHVISDGTIVDPVARALKKRILKQPKQLDLPYRSQYREFFQREYPPQKADPFTLHEAINGSEGMPGIPANSSAGYGYKLPGKTQKKFLMDLNDDGTRRLSPEFQANFDNCHNMAQAGIRFQSVFTDTAKDETLPLDYKLRLFKAGSMPLILLQKMYFGRFVNVFQTHACIHPSSVGVNPHSHHEWRDLLADALQDSEDGCGFSNDYEAYDTSLLRELLHMAFEEVIEWINPPKEKLPVYWVLAWQIINHFTVIFGLLYEGQGGPSGHGLTSVINTIVNLYLLLSTWIALAELAGFVDPDTRKFKPKAYGDDNINFSIRYDGVMLDWSRAQNYLKTKFGVTTSDSDKYSGLQGFIMKNWREMTYLSRSFVISSNIMQAPLPIRRIASTFSYMCKPDDRTTVQAICDSMALELTHHPREVFEEWRNAILNHPWAKELNLSFWSWSYANSIRHGHSVEKPQSFKTALCALPKHDLPSCTLGDSKVLGMPDEISGVDYTQNTTSFAGVGERVEYKPIDTEYQHGIPGFVTTFPAVDGRPVLLGQYTVNAAQPKDTVIATVHMPQDIYTKPMYSGIIKSTQISFDSACFWIETIRPALSCSSLYITGGENYIIAPSGAKQEINHMQIVVEDDMNQENCVEVPYSYWYPVMTPDQMSDVTGGASTPGATFKLRVLTPLRAGLTGFTQTMDVRIWGFLKGLKTHSADPWNGPAIADRPQSSAEQASIEGSTGIPHGSPSHGIKTIVATPPTFSSAVNQSALVTGKIADTLSSIADTLKTVGLNTPTDETTAARMTMTYNPPYQDEARDSLRLTLKKHEYVPETTLGSKETYSDFVKMAKRPMIIYNDLLTTGTQLTMPVCNKYNAPGATIPPSQWTCHPSGALWATLHGVQSCGGTNFLIKITVPGAVEGVFQIQWVNRSGQSVQAAGAQTDPSNCYKRDIRFSGSTEVRFRIPQMNPLPYDRSTLEAFPNDNTSFNDNGTLIMKITSLVSSTIALTGADITIWAAADSKFKVFSPVVPPTVNSQGNPATLYALEPGLISNKESPAAPAGAFKPPTTRKSTRHTMKPQMIPIREFDQDFPVFHPAMGDGIEMSSTTANCEVLKSFDEFLRIPIYNKTGSLVANSTAAVQCDGTYLIGVTSGFSHTSYAPALPDIIKCWARCRGGLQIHLDSDSNLKISVSRYLSTTGQTTGVNIGDLTVPMRADFDLKPWHTFDWPMMAVTPFIATTNGNWTGSSYLVLANRTSSDAQMDIYMNVADEFRLGGFIAPPEVIIFSFP